MQQIAAIKAAHDWMVRSCDADLSQAVARGDMATAERLEEIRQTFDRSVFVLLFGQFETAVTETFEEARNARSANLDWRSRRGWDVPAYRDRRIPFETKLALVMDRRTEAHGRIMRAYALRNHCAHGGSTETVIPIEEFVADLYAWRARCYGGEEGGIRQCFGNHRPVASKGIALPGVSMAAAEVLMSDHDAVDDYELPELTAREVHERVEDWLRRLDDLFARIRNWATAHGPEVKDGEPRPMLEERMERVGEPAQDQPTLVLRSAEGWEISIKPKALWVIGAIGRVDVLSRKGGVHVLIDRAEPLDPPQLILRKVGRAATAARSNPSCWRS